MSLPGVALVIGSWNLNPEVPSFYDLKQTLEKTIIIHYILLLRESPNWDDLVKPHEVT